MRSSTRAARIALAVLWAAVLPSLSGATAEKIRADRPVYTVGTKWFRSDGTWALTRVEHDIYVFSAGREQEMHLSRNLGVARIILSGRVEAEFDPPLDPAWPLEVGKWGVKTSSLLRTTHRFGGNKDARHTWKVESYEDVSVPAGRFKAFRIEHAVTFSIFGGSVHSPPLWTFTAWYAPEVQQLVKGQGNLPGVTFTVVAPGLPAIATPSSPVPGLTPPVPRAPAPAPSTTPPPSAAALPPADTEAPKIVINYPPPDTKVEREQIIVLGLVTDNIGVDRVQVTVNGVDVAQPREGGEAKGRPIRVPATLQPGENVVEVTAIDRAGNVSQVVRTVTRVVSAAAGPPPPKVANRWAVVIGIGQYEHDSIPKLKYASHDAEAVYQFLTTQGGYPKDNVVLLSDATTQKPTLQNIRRALGDFLYRKPAREDMVLIYYAGHGAPEIDAAGIESDGISKYLIPRNADPESLYSTALPMDEIQRIFGRIQAERVVMLLDTCYSGTAGGRTFSRQQLRSTRLNDHFLERLTRSKGRVIITAAGPNEVALETSELGHGVFTYYLLEGLRGRADRNSDGIVTVSELYEYVEDQVDRKARAVGGRQRPLMRGEIEGTLPLARVGR